MEYKKKVIIANTSIALAATFSSVIGQGRDSNLWIFIITYPLLLLTNLFMGIRNFILKNKERGWLHIYATIILLFLTYPLICIMIFCVGGIC